DQDRLGQPEPAVVGEGAAAGEVVPPRGVEAIGAVDDRDRAVDHLVLGPQVRARAGEADAGPRRTGHVRPSPSPSPRGRGDGGGASPRGRGDGGGASPRERGGGGGAPPRERGGGGGAPPRGRGGGG